MNHALIPTRAAALERLSAFLPKAGRAYAARRNYDLGAGHHAHVSMLSPYLRCRLLTEEEVLKAVALRHGQIAAEKFIQEVFWRTYWKGWLEHRPEVWTQYQAGVAQAWNDVQTQSGLRARWEAACKGETGIDCFDVWAEELVETGCLHNHARMWFASIWIFTLDLPWELGADFFLRHLLDGDPASNTLGWRWVAGIQTQGKTYLARTSNISKFTEGRFHPNWQLASKAIPRPSAPVPSAGPSPASDNLNPDKKTGFLIHEEDLSPDFALAGVQPAACAVLQPQQLASPLQAAPDVAAFRGAMLEDTSIRWASRLAPVTAVADLFGITEWARDHGLEQVVTPYAPVGSVAEIFSAWKAQRELPDLCQRVRAYDATAWPYATRGFFPFKKHINSLLEQIVMKRAA